jgi:hypothetical protein
VARLAPEKYTAPAELLDAPTESRLVVNCPPPLMSKTARLLAALPTSVFPVPEVRDPVKPNLPAVKVVLPVYVWVPEIVHVPAPVFAKLTTPEAASVNPAANVFAPVFTPPRVRVRAPVPLYTIGVALPIVSALAAVAWLLWMPPPSWLRVQGRVVVTGTEPA